jgi:hypothetical protein
MPFQRRWLALVALPAFALGGCSGEGQAADSDDSPLAEYFGPNAVSFDAGGMSMSYGPDGAEEYEPTEEDLQNQREFEDLVQQCMADEGFEYVPYVVDASNMDDPYMDAYALPPDEFAEKYGYGISTLHMADSDLPEDQNEQVRQGLSPEALAEYDRALHGHWDEEISEGEEWTPPAPRGSRLL